MLSSIPTTPLSRSDPSAMKSCCQVIASALFAGSVGSDIVLCTMEYYEGSLGGGNLIPRMVGFLNTGEKDFFTKITSVKGMGIKKTLKALCVPIGTIAAAVENGDDKTLQTLPGVGKRMAQQIIAELKGKLQSFAESTAPGQTGVSFKPFQAEALEILIAWGEKRNEAMELIELACKRHPTLNPPKNLSRWYIDLNKE